MDGNLSQIPGIGPKTLAKLSRLKITTATGLLYHFPTRYLDFSKSVRISQVVIATDVTVTGKVVNFKNIYTRNHKNLQKATISDPTGNLDLVWFNQPFISQNITVGQTFSFAGTVNLYHGRLTIFNPEYGQYNTGKIIAVYPETSGLSSKWFRKTIQPNLSKLIAQNLSPELPHNILRQFNLLAQKEALRQIHLPDSPALLERARFRLSLDEILSLQTRAFLQKKDWQSHSPQVILKDQDIQINSFVKSLPFKLTASQLQVWQEIKSDLLSSKQPMNRLLQGDVGSGKTAIALLACYLTSLNQSLSLFVSPTEILANQHYNTFKQYLKDFSVPVHLLTASSKINFEKLEPNSIIISTHAVLYHKKALDNSAALVIFDEQHKFGVKQRSLLTDTLHPPHCLTMTATPIPRTISLTLFGNLDLSTITAPPAGRQLIKTFFVPQPKIPACYEWLKDHIKTTGQQAFIVCPFIDDSETLISVKSAKKEFGLLSNNIFPELKLGLIHGKLKQNKRDDIISQFQAKKIDILVTTPIIEVGVDIPNSTVIIIQSADRFGLAQLHQLRGRVGRGSAQSYCYLFSDNNNEKAVKRLEYLQKHNDGLKIAQYDLEIRGPGEIYSTIQHGFPSLKLANLSDAKLISQSQQILKALIALNPAFDLQSLVKITSSKSTGLN